MKWMKICIFVLAVSMVACNVANSSDITSIKKLELYEENTDGTPEKDALKIFVIFGDKDAKDIRPANGVSMGYKCSIYNYDGNNIGDLIAKKEGKLISENGFTSFIVQLPGIKAKTRVLADISVTLQGGEVLRGKRADTFNPESY